MIKDADTAAARIGLSVGPDVIPCMSCSTPAPTRCNGSANKTYLASPYLRVVGLLDSLGGLIKCCLSIVFDKKTR